MWCYILYAASQRGANEHDDVNGLHGFGGDHDVKGSCLWRKCSYEVDDDEENGIIVKMEINSSNIMRMYLDKCSNSEPDPVWL